MQGYDDISNFKKNTGVVNYKILSEYNVDHVSRKWNVIERVRGLVIADAVFPQGCSLNELQVIPEWQAKSKENITHSLPLTSTVQTDSTQSSATGFISFEMKPSIVNDIDTELFSNKDLFSSLFSIKALQAEVKTNSESMRDIPLKKLFEVATLCP